MHSLYCLYTKLYPPKCSLYLDSNELHPVMIAENIIQMDGPAKDIALWWYNTCINLISVITVGIWELCLPCPFSP